MTHLQLVLYVSSATQPMTEADIAALLVQSRDRNAQLGITGLLLYRDGNFMQAIEGPSDAIVAVYGSICRDPRHTNVITLIDTPVPTRSFAAWSLGLIHLDGLGEPVVLCRDECPPVTLDTLTDNYGAVALLRGFCEQFSVGKRH
ncbi:BLUF domain-containing protein [Derxia lacustris]|uniref:BLUF domain-containing protein n=1 Tax=Derxia lacustris TaxID=764842 RepID=UPI000A1749A5|nr:BLUF domain-containing protein [Derxia lacustris]